MISKNRGRSVEAKISEDTKTWGHSGHKVGGVLDFGGNMDSPCNSKAKIPHKQCRGVDRVGGVIIEKFQCDYSVPLIEVSG